MKKIFVLMMLFTMMIAGLFAYEPNPEFFDVSDDMVYYCEEVEPQYGGNGIRCFLSSPIGMKNDALFYYRVFESEKKLMYVYFSLANEESDEEIKEKYKNDAIDCINRAINKIPFITEKNFWTINEHQYIKIFCKYLKKIQKAELKKQKLSK